MANIVRRNEGATMMPRTNVVDPFDVMREMLSLDPLRALFGTGMAQMPAQTFFPQFEVRETNDAYIFKADLPGVKDDELDITIAQNRLTVSGRREMAERDANDRYYAVERAYGSFTRTFTLPTDIDEGRVDAELRDGVLNLRIPKSPEQQPKKVQVKAGAGGGAKTAKAGSA
ncbi:MAG TPA: Hsp20/alpha crystallin family protein [Polyangia bacterium]|jgi:HSP20 family protein|nr:Hsp20/alpha crystallin family protein [Polyangia bacterium]